MRDLFRGELVRLTAEEPGTRAKVEVQWQRDTEFHRLMDGDPTRMESQHKLREWFEKQSESDFKPEGYSFSVRTLEEDKHIGFFALWVDLIHSEAWVGIGIGDRQFWGKGYGTDVMKVILRYAFTEVNLRRVTLNVFEYNVRAIRSYEKTGFRHEGRMRQVLKREGQRWDMLFMGILREEWIHLQQQERGKIR